MSLKTLALVTSIISVQLLAEQQTADKLFDLSIQELLKVTVVSATKQEQSIEQAPATIRVINREHILARGYINLQQALADLPGIDLIDVHGAYSVIHTFRGSYGDENKRLLLLVDGILQNSINSSFELAGPSYSLHNIERIEVIWGPASALYGANAFSGIINLITRKDESNTLEYSRGLGSYDTLYDRVFIADTLSKVSYSLSAYRYRTDGPKLTNRHPNFTDAYVDDATHLNTQLNYQSESYSLAGGLQIYDNPVGDGTFANSPTTFLNLPDAYPQNPGAGGFLNFNINGEPGSLWHSYFRTAFVDLENNLNAQTTLNSQVIYRETGIDSDSYSYPTSADAVVKFRGASESKASSMTIQLAYQFDKASNLITGVQYTDSDMEKGYRAADFDPEITNIDGLAIVNWNGGLADRKSITGINKGVYIQYFQQMDWFKLTELTIGSRYDNNSIYGSSFNPRLGMVSQLTDKFTLKALYGSAYRAPSVFELFGSSPVRQPNPDLEPETVDSFELALHYQQRNRLLKAVAFENRLDNVITEGNPIGGGFTQIQNTGKATIKGLEIEFQQQVTDDFHLTASYSYQQGKQSGVEQQSSLINVPRHKAKLAFDYSFYSGYNLHWMNHWFGDINTPDTNPIDQIESYELSYLVLTTPQYFNNQLNFSIRVNNLFDKAYVHPGHRSANGITYSPVNEQPGRNFTAHFTWVF